MNAALMLLLLFDGDGDVTQSGPLVGIWSNVTHLQTAPPIKPRPATTELKTTLKTTDR